MFPGTRKIIGLLLFLLTSSLWAYDKLDAVQIESDPSGARVEVNRQFICITPCSWPVGRYALDPNKHWVGSKRLSVPLSMRVTKDGYIAQEFTITRGPLRWISLNGSNQFTYYVVSSTAFNIQLPKIGDFFGQNPAAIDGTQHEPFRQLASEEKTNDQPLSEMIRGVLPSVVQIRTEDGLGSGFIVSETGVVVTNKHVVGNSESVEVITSRGQSISSTLIYREPNRDLALVKLPGGPFPYLRLQRPEQMAVGQDVIAIGSPRGLQNSVTRGTLSAFRELKGISLLQTDTAINPGNSGGPLLDRQGKVVGVNTLKLIIDKDSGLNFAISVAEVAKMVKDRFAVDLLLPSQAAEDGIVPNLAAKAALTNEDVVHLLSAGISESLVSLKIQSSPGAYHLGPDDLISLKQKGVSDSVIAAMMKATK